MPFADTPEHAAERLLLQATARGDQAAFAALYDRLNGPLFALCLRVLHDEGAAEDALQEAFANIWRNAPKYDPARGSAFTWAVHITRCKAIDHFRARGRRLPETKLDPLPEKAPEGQVETSPAERNELAQRVRQIVAALPEDQSRAVDLAFFGGLTHSEIAEHLGEPLGTVKARIRRAMLKLRDALKGERP